VSEFTDWSKCSKTCGHGLSKRTRTVTREPKHDGRKCPPLEEEEECSTHQCPVDCVVSDFGPFSECSATCGGGTQTRTRKITTDQAHEGAACPALTETEECNTNPCPVDCEVSEFTDWSKCSKTCGHGLSKRTRTVTREPKHDGRKCPPLEEEEECSTHQCPVDCVVSDFGPFSECSATCGGGTQTRTRKITTDQAHAGAVCPALEESEACNTQICDKDSDGVADELDNCPENGAKTDPGACGCDQADDDTDNDGTPDCKDGCPDDAHKTEEGVCGCNDLDHDLDGDGTEDCNDKCSHDPAKTDPGECGCGVADTDVNGDGIIDCTIGCMDESAINFNEEATADDESCVYATPDPTPEPTPEPAPEPEPEPAPEPEPPTSGKKCTRKTKKKCTKYLKKHAKAVKKAEKKGAKQKHKKKPGKLAKKYNKKCADNFAKACPGYPLA